MLSNNKKLYIYCFIIYTIDCYIIVPLKIYNNKYIQNIWSYEKIEENDLSLILYNTIYIGEPKQNAIFILSSNEYNFYMVINNNSSNNSYYDFRLSKTNNINIDDMKAGQNLIFMSEKFFFENRYLNSNICNETGIENINFILYLKKPKFIKNYNFTSDINSYIIFGLKLTEGFDKVEYSLNLIRQLKRKSAIKNYKWFIEYNASLINEIKFDSNYFNNINMIIGAEPHEIYSNIYREDDLKLINAKALNGYVNWGLYFNKIFYQKNNDTKNKIFFELTNNDFINNIKFEDYLTVDIKHDLIFINSPKLFFDSINKNFFNKLFIEKKCFLKENNYIYIYCENQKEIKDYIRYNFKDIYFKNNELNYEFVLGYQDLFIINDNKILFLIISQNEIKRWTFGIPFLRKYILIYDYDHNVIGFYKKINQKNYLKKEDNLINIIKY